MDAAGFDEAFEEGTATLLAEIEELKRVVSRFSDFAKMPKPQLEDVDLPALFQQTARLYAARIEQGHVAIELDLPPQPVTVRADPHLLGQARGNLILNALDAMPDGGRLVLRAESRNGRGVLEVSDTGQGLTDEEQRRLFTPTTPRSATAPGWRWPLCNRWSPTMVVASWSPAPPTPAPPSALDFRAVQKWMAPRLPSLYPAKCSAHKGFPCGTIRSVQPLDKLPHVVLDFPRTFTPSGLGLHRALPDWA